MTFVRLVQSSIEDIAYAHRIGLLRNLYVRLSPELEPYIVLVKLVPDIEAQYDPYAWTRARSSASS